MTAGALPVDGISTTYWPYEVAVSEGLIAVATNTGAVVVRRDAVSLGRETATSHEELRSVVTVF